MECPHLPELKYDELGMRLRLQAQKNGLPLSGGIELTQRCNLRCAHCYVNTSPRGQDHLTTDGIDRLLAEMAEAGCLWLFVTGGEPLVRRDFSRIYSSAKRKGFLLTLFTNATLISDEHVSLFRDLRPYKVEVSVYGATEKVYENVTRVRGSYRQCLRGVERLASLGLPLSVKTVALTTNWHEIGAIEQLARRFGAQFRFDPMINGRLDRRPGPETSRIAGGRSDRRPCRQMAIVCVPQTSIRDREGAGISLHKA
jgi:MoaA/NifB/PqqE/SkfB family radical SAM enzyme